MENNVLAYQWTPPNIQALKKIRNKYNILQCQISAVSVVPSETFIAY